MVASPGSSTAHGDLVPRDDPQTAGAVVPGAPAATRHEDDVAIERQQICDALDRCGGNQSRAAKLLGISRNTLIARIERHGLARPLTPRRQPGVD
jgi:transcriptional regulator of acetoin/glycerol metabolism